MTRHRIVGVAAAMLVHAISGGASSVCAEEPPAPSSLARGDALASEAFPLQDDSAQEEDISFSRSGGYVGVGGTFALQNFSVPGDQDDSGSILFRAGYRGLPYVAVEFLGEVLPKFEGSDSLDNDVSGFAVTINAKLLVPLGRAEPYLMAGIGLLDIDEDRDRRHNRRDDFAFRSAAGFDFYLTPRWVLYAEAAYMLPTGEVKRFDYATFGGGILFRF
jgi:opacity protein-like surface antigen